MPNTAVPAAAEGLPKVTLVPSDLRASSLSRRSFLAGITAAPVLTPLAELAMSPRERMALHGKAVLVALGDTFGGDWIMCAMRRGRSEGVDAVAFGYDPPSGARGDINPAGPEREA